MTSTKGSLSAIAGAALCVLLALAGPAQAAKGRFQQVNGGAFSGVTGPTLPAAQATASDLIVNLAGLQSMDSQDDPINTVLVVDALAGATVDGIAWNVSLSTVGASWLSEATILITNSAGDGVVFSPGFGDDFSGAGTYADSASLVALGLAFDVLGDGKLTFQLFEGFDDNIGAADATYTAGGLNFTGIGVSAVPEPASYGLMALGLFAVAGAARRRRRAD